jgi:dihydropteroate synthase
MNIRGYLGGVSVGDTSPTRIMGVINLTKNSFYGPSVRTSDEEILGTALKMKEEGADLLDIGARSTAPYKKYDIAPATEERLLRSAIRLLHSKLDVPLSADTLRIGAARAAMQEGVSIINDVYGLHEQDGILIAKLVSNKKCSIILTAHETDRGGRSNSPMARVEESITQSLRVAAAEEIGQDQIAIDPGIGFFKDEEISSADWNTEVLARLTSLRRFALPVCAGVSRKRFIGTLLGDKPPESRLYGSLAATAISVYNGAHVVRTHDVRETAECARISEAIRNKRTLNFFEGEANPAVNP